MTNLETNRTWIFGSRRRAAMAALAMALTLTVVTTHAAHAQSYRVLHTFSNGQDGGSPYAGLTMDKGNLYGTTLIGGAGYGTVFKMTHKGSGWTFDPLYSFAGGNDGFEPAARVIFGPNGTLYGTTMGGGGGQSQGIVFNLKPSPRACVAALCPWGETVLYRFNVPANGSAPGYADVIFDPAGNLYGTTTAGGANSEGVVYELTPSGTESPIYSLTDSSGAFPYSGVIFDQSGNLYGTAIRGGGAGLGAAYELTPSGSGWMENTIYSVQGAAGQFPYGGLISDRSGNLYGTTNAGGKGGGAVFELTPSNGKWAPTVLYSFSNGNSGPYSGVTIDALGNLYGTTYADGAHGKGSVFKLTLSNGTWSEQDLYSFTGGSDGANPIGGVVLDASGNLYGTASGGGSGSGVVWEIAP
jgi:uncharacterized repeat protein (TIGR03803 family)